MNVLRGRALGIKQKSTPKISSKNLDLMVNFERRDSNVTQSSSSTYRDFLPKVTQQMEVTIAEALSIRTNPMTWNKLSKDFEQPALNELFGLSLSDRTRAFDSFSDLQNS
jgi:type III secretory pathway component EscR